MARDIYSKLDAFEREGQKLQQAVAEVQARGKRQQNTTNIFKEGAAELLKGLGVNKQYSRPVLNVLHQGRNQRDPMDNLEGQFNSWLAELNQFVSTISEETKTNRENSQKLLRKFNRVERKVQLETKLKHALRAIRELKNMNLVYNTELETRKQVTQTDEPKHRSTSESPVAGYGVKELLAKGESEVIEFKEAIPSSVRKIAEELVALANHRGGAVVLGVDDDGHPVGMESIDRAEQAVVNVVRDAVHPPMSPSVSRIQDNDKTLLMFEITRFTQNPYSVDGTFYKRVGTSKKKLTGSELRDMVS